MFGGRLDKSDQPGIQIAAPVQLLRYRQSQLAGSEDENVLSWRGDPPCRIQRKPRQQDEQGNQHGADEEHSSPDQKVRENEVDRPEQKRACAQRSEEHTSELQS